MIPVHRETRDNPFNYDRELFASLRRAFIAGDLSLDGSRLNRPPATLDEHDARVLRRSQDPASATTEFAAQRIAGEAAIRAGEVAALVLNGGLATRFGGLVKGVVPVTGDDPRRSFLALKLGALRATARRFKASIPAIVMCSFATRAASDAHLQEIAWADLKPSDRLTFDQSLLPRIDREGVPLVDRPEASKMPQSALYAAPGHGDTLAQAVRSGLVNRLRARGIRHVLVSNVDNLGATIDAQVLGLHLAAVAKGASASVEVVRRQPGDVGGCIAEVDGRALIVEGFRLPPATDPERYLHFNTNTIWLTLDALASEPPLTFFPVARRIPWVDGQDLEIIQFEQLIGQLTEHLPSAYLEVDRQRRFVPIKTRDDLRAAEPWLLSLIADIAR